MAAAIKRMPPEEALSAKYWNGRTICSTGRTRFTPMEHYITLQDLYHNSVPLFSELPRRGLLGNWASEVWGSR
jgi:hypothetical protein